MISQKNRWFRILKTTMPRCCKKTIWGVYRGSMRILKEMVLMFRIPKYDSKVFCIGYNKTGTTSLNRALRILGYRHCGWNRKVWKQYHRNEIVKILKRAAKFESFDDLPWLKEDMIPILDKVFPNSKFIYLTREEEAWKKSIYNWTLAVFGERVDVDKKWREYKTHEKFVLDYFADRTEKDFIVLNVKDEMGFQKLAAFLGLTTERKTFPHANPTSNYLKSN